MRLIARNVLYAIMGALIAYAVMVAFDDVANAATPPQANVSWNAPTTYVDGSPITSTSPITYQLYIGSSGKEAKFGAPISNSTSMTVSSLPVSGTQWCAQVSAIVAGVESALSTEACTVVPFPTPNSPIVITIVIH